MFGMCNATSHSINKYPRTISKCTLPIKADEPPSFDMPTATLAGAPPGAFLKVDASASETPPTVGTKSINISPKQTTSEPFAPSFIFNAWLLESPTDFQLLDISTICTSITTKSLSKLESIKKLCLSLSFPRPKKAL